MPNIGMGELVLILLVVLIVFGAKRIPEIARGLGQGIREFKSATNEIKRELDVAAPPPPRQIQPPAQPPIQQQTPSVASDPAQNA